MMPHEVIGPFTNMEKAVSKVEVLGLKGYRSDDINIIAKEDIAKELEDKIDATIISHHYTTEVHIEQNHLATRKYIDMSEELTEIKQPTTPYKSIIISIKENDYLTDDE